MGLEGASEWSQPNLFEVDAGPSRAELEDALHVLQRYLGTGGGIDGLSATRGGSRPGRGDTPEGAAEGPPAERLPASASQAAVPTPAASAVEGEVRTVDASEASRLWGRGRPGTEVYIKPGGACSNGSVKFGLSYGIAEWASAASACPAGYWVCTLAERGTETCDTARPDSGVLDGRDCDRNPISWDEDDHLGWLADELGTSDGATRYETSASVIPNPLCQALPVWCCWE